MISPAEQVVGGRAGGVGGWVHALASPASAPVSRCGRSGTRKSPVPIYLFKNEIKNGGLHPFLLPFCSISVLCAVSVVCLQLEKVIHLVIKIFHLFKQGKRYQFPGFLK